MTTNMGRVVATLTPILLSILITFFSMRVRYGAPAQCTSTSETELFTPRWPVLHRCSIGQNTGALYRKRQPQAQSLTEAAPSMRAAKLAPTASSMRTAA